jgi:predicted ATP-grasp superfamily ATP-dependent carboligase
MSITVTETIMTHKYLMNKTKHELASMVLEYCDDLADEQIKTKKLQKEIEKLQERMTKMEILLQVHDPEWETARIFSDKPMMTDEEAEEIFRGYRKEEK